MSSVFLKGISVFNGCSEQFLQLSEDDHVRAFGIIGQIACTKGQRVTDPSILSYKELQQFRCAVCDVSMCPRRSINEYELSDAEELFNAIANLYQLAQKAKLGRPRVAALMAMKRLLSHSGNLVHLDISHSSIGRWCLQGLKSSTRDLRIAAG